ncbi:MAG: hypothetical protein ACI8QS_001301 [Planctomycetota bacterium]|jgi:hypothetical protein
MQSAIRRHSQIPSLVLPLLVFSALGACGDKPGEVPTDEGSGSHLVFADVAADSALDFTPTCGDPRRWTIAESNGTGAAWLDHDGDGDLDLFVGNGPQVEYVDDMASLALSYPEGTRLFANLGALQFEDVTVDANARVDAWVNGVVVGDPDGDGDPDIYLTVLGDDVFLRNDAGRFENVPASESGLENGYWGTGASFGDPDRDGDLDLYVANYCLFDPAAPPAGGKRMDIDGVQVGWGPEGENEFGYNAGAPNAYFRNDGTGHFTEASEAAGLNLDRDWCSYAALFRDMDDDGWPEILVSNDVQPTNLFHNQGGGSFLERGLEMGFATDADGKPTAAMGLFVADVDRDGDLDSLRTNFDFEANGLFVNDGAGVFRELSARTGLALASFERLGWGGGFFDADLDGDLDLVVANGHVMPQSEEIGMNPYLQQSQLFEGIQGDAELPQWREVVATEGSGFLPLRNSRGVAIGDPDDDGDLDLVIVDIDAPLRFLENRSERHGDWIGLKLQGAAGNRDAIGARVTLTVGTGATAGSWTRELHRVDGLFSSHDPRLHFGIGDAGGAAITAEVRWPDGTTSTHGNLEAGRYQSIIAPQK